MEGLFGGVVQVAGIPSFPKSIVVASWSVEVGVSLSVADLIARASLCVPRHTSMDASTGIITILDARTGAIVSIPSIIPVIA